MGPSAVEPSLYGGIGFGRGWWSIDAEARADLASGAQNDATHGYRLSAGFVGGGLVPCSHLRWAYGCVGVWLGALRTTIDGGAPPSQTSFYAAFGPRLGASFRVVGDLEVDVHLTGAYSPTRIEPRVAGAAVWDTSPVSAALGAGLLEHFP
jgi:hypothetical protein